MAARVEPFSNSPENAPPPRALLRTARRYRQDLERRNAELARRQTEVERLQAQIVHQEKMASLGRLAAGVAHELNNPAGFIHGNMEILRECAAGIERLLGVYESASLPPHVAAQVETMKEEIDYENTLAEMRSMIADCHSGAVRIRDVVQNLRTFSRLDEAEYKKVALHEGIESTIRLLSRYYSSDRITLHRDYCDLPPVDCYAGQLNQVWMNLLANAAQALGHDGGEVSIRTRLEGEAVTVSVKDTGDGIAPEHLGQIFDPFFTTKPVGEGTGLGLSITYGIVERHGGTITVESRVGFGTTFTVSLPIQARRPEGESHSGQRGDQRQGDIS
jgi:two-component system NtrC family sensor kinase